MFWDCYEGFNFFAAIRIDLVETLYTASEGDAPLEVCAVIVSLMGNLDCDLVVAFSEVPGTAGMTIYQPPIIFTTPKSFNCWVVKSSPQQLNDFGVVNMITP